MAFFSRALRGLAATSTQHTLPRLRVRLMSSSTELAPIAAAAPSYTITDAPVPRAATTIRRGYFVMRGIKGHTKKLNPLARQIIGLRVQEAITQMAYSPKKRGKTIKTALERAVLNADFYHPTGITASDLTVEKVRVM
jgi:hypothetical protein